MAEVLESPDYRAVYLSGKLTLVPYQAWLPIRSGYATGFFGELDGQVTIADFTIFRGSRLLELIVNEHCSCGDESFRASLIEFTSLLGYARLWIGDELVEINEIKPWDLTARTSCEGCGTHWFENSPEFWTRARRAGVYPPFCKLCNHLLPVWTTSAGTHHASTSRVRSTQDGDRAGTSSPTL